MALETGQQFGNYVLDKPLGQGGWGEVWLAHHAKLSHKPQVAIKFILRPRPQEMERFEREVTILDKLRENRNTIKAEDYGQQDGIPYLVMDYAGGGNLSTMMREGMTLTTIANYINQMANALDYAHQNGIIHRDLKPSNILFKADGTLVLADFGIAHDDEDERDMTETGIGMGTAEYMAPEQFTDAKHVTTNADIYGLGILAFQMVTGRLPFSSRKEGKSLYQLMTDHLTLPVPPMHDFNPNLPNDLQTVIEKAMAKKPEDRYQTAGQFAHDFQAALPELEATVAITPEMLIKSRQPDTASKPFNAPPVAPTVLQPVHPVSTPALALQAIPAMSATVNPSSTGYTPPQPYIFQQQPPPHVRKAGLIIGLIAGGVVILLGAITVLLILLLTRPADDTARREVVVVNPPNLGGRVPLQPSQRPPNQGTIGTNSLSMNSLGLNPYPNLKKINLPSNVNEQFKKELSTLATYTQEGFSTNDAAMRVRDYYKDQLERKGWQNVTQIFANITNQKEALTQMEGIGGFFMAYQKDNTMFGVSIVPSNMSKAIGMTEVNANEVAVVHIFGTFS